MFVYELKQFFQIQEDLKRFNIHTFAINNDEVQPPFAVVGSNTVVENEEGHFVRGRRYPWGCVDIENPVQLVIFSFSSN